MRQATQFNLKLSPLLLLAEERLPAWLDMFLILKATRN